MTKLFCDLKTDEEKSAFFLSGRGYETGVIAHSIQNDVAMAYHRCAEYQKELKALQPQDREDAERLDWLEEQAQTSRTGVSIDYVYDAEDGYVNEKGYRFMRHRFIGPLGRSAREAIDHARRAEGDGE